MRAIFVSAVASGLSILLASPIQSADFLKYEGNNGDEPMVQIEGVKSVKPARITAPELQTGPKVEYVNAPAFEEMPKPTFQSGDILPVDYYMLFDVANYNLPRPRDGWVYFTVGRDIYRVDLNSREILERMDVSVH